TPSDTLLRGRFDVASLSADEVDHYREHLFEEHLPQKTLQSEPIDALAAELDDFVESLRAPRQPRVTGEHGAQAVRLAEQILDEIDTHRWSDGGDKPVGTAAGRTPGIIPGPHWHMAPSRLLARRKEAG
ncbi:MAG: hypothetical protein ACYC6Y_06615, partial [Thermoguttaceae bacterium]